MEGEKTLVSVEVSSEDFHCSVLQSCSASLETTFLAGNSIKLMLAAALVKWYLPTGVGCARFDAGLRSFAFARSPFLRIPLSGHAACLAAWALHSSRHYASRIPRNASKQPQPQPRQ